MEPIQTEDEMIGSLATDVVTSEEVEAKKPKGLMTLISEGPSDEAKDSHVAEEDENKVEFDHYEPQLPTSGKELISLFEHYIVEHGRVYHSPEEKEMRFQVFKECVVRVNKLNRENNPTCWFGLNLFSDRFPDELPCCLRPQSEKKSC